MIAQVPTQMRASMLLRSHKKRFGISAIFNLIRRLDQSHGSIPVVAIVYSKAFHEESEISGSEHTY